jgi:hypothetical protein
MASVGFEALGQYRLGGVIPLKRIFTASMKAGSVARRMRRNGRAA